MGLLFGNDESLECIQTVPLKGAQNEPLCLGYKSTITFVGAGAWIKDDGYILKVVGSKDTYYPMPPAEELKELQTGQLMPDPLPPYSLPLWRYGLGYSLWILIALTVALMAWNSARKKKRAKEDAEAPISVGPPPLETEKDRFIADAVRPMLKVNETIDQQAYGFPDPMTLNGDLIPGQKFAHCVLTNQRLIFVNMKKNKPTGEVLGIEELPRARIVAAVTDDGLMQFLFDDRSTRLFWVRRKEKGFSNQVRFIRDVPKIFAVQRAAAAVAPAPA